VNDGPPQNRDVSEEPNADWPLTLSDSDGSTLPVGEGSKSPEASARTPDPSERSGAEGGTTGGFDTLLGKIVVHAGLATPEEVELCKTLVDEAAGTESPGTLSDILVSRDFVTRHQLDRLREDFEAKKSGQHIPGFRIKRKLGSGAMATVFLARQLSLDRLVAIKILPKKFSGNEKFIERFYREGKAAAQLNHPNIVSAYDVGRAGDHHYFVMEYVDGPTLYDRLSKRQRFSEREAIHIVLQVAAALEHAHARGFVHRDIKPKNVMITREGTVKLADLGLARAMSDQEAAKQEAGRAYGTPYYISPEQIRGEMEITPAADIYGLGATLFHMVTGRVPFEGSSPSQVMHRHLKSPLQPPDHINPEISAGLAQVIEMMMAKRAKDRYQSASDLIEDLRRVREGRPPLFAHRTLDQGAITDVITGAAETAPTIPRHEPPRDQRLSRNPTFMSLVVLQALSVIVIILLLVALLSR
jgi:serine/threonine-protein kinase